MTARILSHTFCYSIVFMGLCLISAGPAVSQAGTSPTSSISLQLDDDTTQALQSLEIGRSLFAKITGLAPGQQVSVVLQDAVGWPVVTANVVADPSGEAQVTPLWSATGIIGCDCTAGVGAYLFPRGEDALVALAGETFEVIVSDTSGTPLATALLPLISPVRPVAFPADATGCPRYRLQDIESLHLVVFGGAAGTQTSVTVAPGFTGPLVEVRQNKPEGPVFSLSGQSPEVILLWPGPNTTPGGYRVVTSGGGWPTMPLNFIGPINSGLLIDDHSCPPFRD